MPGDPEIRLAETSAPSFPCPPGVVFQLAPDGKLIVRLFLDGHVEVGEGAELEEAARKFWAYVVAASRA